ncbi:MFS transporter [Streptomyces sp. V4-01]|uniref:MFS transporter n=1 Tax=Actinacidiphila polyblastidii TaxID=3110430 RepID=A0ABU7PID1_9ACTN|nr:MFS transporter [Streptomyces sp. V4-01]
MSSDAPTGAKGSAGGPGNDPATGGDAAAGDGTAGDGTGRGARPAALWTRDFRLYFTLRTVSLFGDAMMPIAVTIGVLHAGYGASGVGYAFASWSAPVALLVLFGGVLADRYTPRLMMAVSDVARVGTQSLLAVVFLTGAGHFWQIVVLQIAAGAATATFQPGVASVLPQVAEDVQRANGVLRVAEALVTLVGPALAGVLAATAGSGTVLAVDAGTFAVSALCLAALRTAGPGPAADGGAMMRNLVRGWHEFRSRTWLWSVILIWSFYGLLVFGPAQPLTGTVIVGEHGAAAFGVVSSVFGAGAVGGGLIAMRFRPRRPLFTGACVMASFAACPLVGVFRLPVPVICAGWLLAGVGFAVWNVLWLTTLQTHVPADVLNRVYAYDVAGSTLILPVGRVLSGPAAGLFGLRHVLAAATVFALVATACMVAVPAVRSLRRDPADPTPSSPDPLDGDGRVLTPGVL